MESRFHNMPEPQLLGYRAKLAALSHPDFVAMVCTPSADVIAMQATMNEIGNELRRRRLEREQPTKGSQS